MNTTHEHDKKEKKIEYIVVFLVLLFFLFLTLFNLRGCESKQSNILTKTDTNHTAIAYNSINKSENHISHEEHSRHQDINENALKVQALKDTETKRLKALALKAEQQRIAKENALKVQALKDAEAKRLKALALKAEQQRIAKENALKAQALKDAEAKRLKALEVQNIDKHILAEEVSIVNDINKEQTSPTTYVLKGVYFETSSSKLTEQSTRQLDTIAHALRQHSSVNIRLRGHTDNRGSKALNLRLSLSRANAVKQALILRGINTHRIHTQGKESTQPITSNQTKEGRLTNRRVDIAVID